MQQYRVEQCRLVQVVQLRQVHHHVLLFRVRRQHVRSLEFEDLANIDPAALRQKIDRPLVALLLDLHRHFGVLADTLSVRHLNQCEQLQRIVWA